MVHHRPNCNSPNRHSNVWNHIKIDDIRNHNLNIWSHAHFISTILDHRETISITVFSKPKMEEALKSTILTFHNFDSS